MIPLGEVIFYAAGRHPLAGIAAAFTGVSGGFSATFFVPSSLDPLLAGLTQVAARLSSDPAAASVVINPLNNYYFTSASTLLVVLIGWFLTDKVIEPRLNKTTPVHGDAAGLPKIDALQANEIKGLRWAGIAMLASRLRNVYRTRGDSLSCSKVPLVKLKAVFNFVVPYGNFTNDVQERGALRAMFSDGNMASKAFYGEVNLTRGMFSSLIENDAYKESEKNWIVELQRFDTYWYDLVDDPLAGIPSRAMLIKYLTEIRKQVEERLEKRFVYFISSRKRVRFDASKKPKYGFFDNELKLSLLIGKERKKVKVSINFGVKRGGFKPSVTVTDGFITIQHENGNKLSRSVYDFLEHVGIDLGHPKKVEYVGYTQEPEARPTKGSHSGLTDVLRRVSNEDNDIFVTFNLFKVISLATGSPSLINFAVPNAMTDEIKVDLEGRIIEKCFILYFDSENQFRNKAKERTELINNLKHLGQENKIRAIHICYEPDGPSEHSVLCSSKVEPKSRHVFAAKLNGEDLQISPGSEYFPDSGFILPV